MIHITIAQEKDLETIANLAKVIWNEHYVPFIGQEQVDYMLAKIYNHHSLVEQLSIKKHVFYLIKNDDEVLGFLSVSSESSKYAALKFVRFLAVSKYLPYLVSIFLTP